jgi:hypothetical protein
MHRHAVEYSTYPRGPRSGPGCSVPRRTQILLRNIPSSGTVSRLNQRSRARRSATISDRRSAAVRSVGARPDATDRDHAPPDQPDRVVEHASVQWRRGRSADRNMSGTQPKEASNAALANLMLGAFDHRFLRIRWPEGNHIASHKIRRRNTETTTIQSAPEPV